MTDQTETFTASMEARLAEFLGLARALLAMTMLVGQTVPHVLKATVGMPPGVSLIVYLVPILQMTVLWRKMGTSTA
jgi:hypothetical protein